jgi:hypothetical protein
VARRSARSLTRPAGHRSPAAGHPGRASSAAPSAASRPASRSGKPACGDPRRPGRAARVGHLGDDPAIVARGDSLRAGDLVEQRLGHPAAVLVALAVIQALDDVPEAVLMPGRARGAQRPVRVGPEEREARARRSASSPGGRTGRRAPERCGASTRRSTGTGDLRTPRASPGLLDSPAHCRSGESRRGWREAAPGGSRSLFGSEAARPISGRRGRGRRGVRRRAAGASSWRSMGHCPFGIPDLEQADLSKVDMCEGV